MPTPYEHLDTFAEKVLAIAAERQIVLRLMGSLGIRKLCSSCSAMFDGSRLYKDVDFAGLRDQQAMIQNLFRDQGWAEDNAIVVETDGYRLRFEEHSHNLQTDVFLDRLEANHVLDWRDRLEIAPKTLSAADMLLSKLQRVIMRDIDEKDAICLLTQFQVNADDNEINEERIAAVLSRDWGFFYTVTQNLKQIRRNVEANTAEQKTRQKLLTGIDSLLRKIGTCPKTKQWKLRAILGERLRWYRIVEDRHGFTF